MATNSSELMAKMEAPKANGNGKALSVADQVAQYLSRSEVKQQLAMAVPKHFTGDRLARIALTTIRTTPQLLECTVPSLVAATMQAAQLGLEPGLLGHCYFVPFNKNIAPKGQPPKWIKEVQFIAGYKGLIDLARRTGSIVTVAAEAIYSNDKFVYRKGFEEVLEHEPNFDNRGECIGFYAYATTKDGGRYASVMTMGDVEKIRQRSKAKDSGPWVTDFEEMGKKTVLRRLCKYLPMSIEIAQTIRADEEREYGDLPVGSSIELNLGALPAPALNEAEGSPATIEHGEPPTIDMTHGQVLEAVKDEQLPNFDTLTEEQRQLARRRR